MNLPSGIRKRRIYRVTLVGLVVNLFLSAGKLVAGIAGRSGAMVADAVHSVSDAATDLVVIAFARISAKPGDATHAYGHGKFETLAAILVALALAALGGGVLVHAVRAIRDVAHGEVLPRPGVVALVAAVVSIAVKEALYRYTIRAAREVESASMAANAWHHRSDALSSLGTLAGIGCAYFLGERWRLQGGVRPAARRGGRAARTLAAPSHGGRNPAHRRRGGGGAFGAAAAHAAPRARDRRGAASVCGGGDDRRAVARPVAPS